MNDIMDADTDGSLEPNPDDLYFWVDVETTGLNPTKDHLLEIAVILTTTLDVSTELYSESFTIGYSDNKVEWMRHYSRPVVRDMHDRTNLWSRCTMSVDSVHDIEQRIIDGIYKVVLDDMHREPDENMPKIIPAGNSVSFDVSIIKNNMPELSEMLHYQIMDMSTVQWFLRNTIDAPYFEKRLEHSAMSDIEESIAQYQFLADLINGGRPVETDAINAKLTDVDSESE